MKKVEGDPEAYIKKDLLGKFEDVSFETSRVDYGFGDAYIYEF